jgi:predicted phage terminase large subunit-like protein
MTIANSHKRIDYGPPPVRVGSRRRAATSEAGGGPTLAAYTERTTGFALDDWQNIAAARLERLKEQKGQRILIHGPPQFGKSLIVSQRLPSFLLGYDPKTRIRLACYNITHAERFSKVNLALMRSSEYAQMFPAMGTRVPSVCPADEWSTRARSAILDANPSFKALGLGTGFTGLGVDTLIIDDPYKNRDEARSEAVNASVKGWWEDVVRPRLNPDTNVVVMFHRWWEGDFAGYLIEQGGWELLRFPALADGKSDDPTKRSLDESLSPRYSFTFLDAIRQTQSDTFYSLYQGTPFPPDGNLFKAGRVELVKEVPADGERVRFWDRAATPGGGDYTVGVLIQRTAGRYYVLDVVRGQWSTDERDRIIRETAQRDNLRFRHGITTVGEEEPGSAGKDQAAAFVRLLAGYSVDTERATGDKVTRADAYASQWNAGNVSLLAADWTIAYQNELLAFPSGKHDDQVDASSGAFNRLALDATGFSLPYDERGRR